MKEILIKLTPAEAEEAAFALVRESDRLQGNIDSMDVSGDFTGAHQLREQRSRVMNVLAKILNANQAGLTDA